MPHLWKIQTLEQAMTRLGCVWRYRRAWSQVQGSANPSEMCLLGRGVIQVITRQRDGVSKDTREGEHHVCVCAHACTCRHMNEHMCPHSTSMVEMGVRLDLRLGATVIGHKQLEWMENQVWRREERDMNDRSWRALYIQRDEAVSPRPLGWLPEMRL